MTSQYFSEFDISHEHLYNELDRLRSENYHLKNRLSHIQNINKGQSKQITAMSRKLKQFNGSKQHYRNGRKKGSRGFNG